ncbi:MAG: 2-oxoglutarate and iron-dependent oxygenase domain-containing protein, partial [Caulobacterales bacterium]
MPFKGVPPIVQRDHADLDSLGAAMGESYRRYGFAVIADHGLDQDLIDRALAAVKAFFALPEETKRAYFIAGGGGQRGYTPFGTEAA